MKTFEARNMKFNIKFIPSLGSYRVFDGKRLMAPVNRFLESVEARGLSICTARAYAFDLVFLFRWLALGEKAVGDLTQADLQNFLKFQVKAGGRAQINQSTTYNL